MGVTALPTPDKPGAAVPWTALLLVTAVLLAVTGIGAVVARSEGPGPRDGEIVAGERPGQPPTISGRRPPAGHPLRLRIPEIGVIAALVPLGLNADRTLEVPRYEEAGWYAHGSRPGETGPAVIAAHVDSTTGPAVFYRLEELKPGHAVHVDYDDGTVTFAVRESQTFTKSAFPTDRVYGATHGPELRLITCDGTFDRTARSYTSNLVVWADLAATT